jgi:hypothetical protein
MHRTAVLVVGLAILLVSPVDGVDLVIGQVALHLGMPQDEALAALSKDFEPKLVSQTEGRYVLWFRGPNPLGKSGGSVWFKDGKLYRASKDWGETPTSRDGVNAVDGLFAALADIAGSGGRIGRVKAETLRAPGSPGITGSQVKVLTIELAPDREVRLQITDPIPNPGGYVFQTSAEVDEILVALPAPK